MVAGLICAGLHLKFDGMQVHERAVVSAEALAAMVRAAVAGAAAERAARPGSAADRRSVPGVPATPAAAAPSSIGVQAVTSSGPAGPSNRATAPEAEVAGSVLNA
jgi:hypothetical protein